MTDRWGALLAINDSDDLTRQALLDQFHRRFGGEKLLLDKWFLCQAISRLPDTFNQVQSLSRHPDYDRQNPNSIRALIGGFCMHNTVHFHRPDGKAYAFLAEKVQDIDSFNPSLAARLVIPLTQWRLVDAARQDLMKAQLSLLLAGLPSAQLYEVVSKALLEPVTVPSESE